MELLFEASYNSLRCHLSNLIKGIASASQIAMFPRFEASDLEGNELVVANTTLKDEKHTTGLKKGILSAGH